MNMEISKSGTAKERPVNNAKGAAFMAGLNDLSLLNSFVVISKTMSGNMMLTIAWGKAVQNENWEIKAALSAMPKELRADVTGVPTAPNETAVESKTNVIIAAAIGGKPRETSKGPAKAAGVPKPAAASIKEQKEKPIIHA